jgi:hypothetical protein
MRRMVTAASIVCILLGLSAYIWHAHFREPKAPVTADSVQTATGYVQYLRTIEVDQHHYSEARYWSAVDEQIREPLSRIESPRLLKEIFYLCLHEWHNQPELPQDRLQEINQYAEATQAVLFRLTEIKTDESARVMADLFFEESAGYDAGFAEMAVHAVSLCGKRILPYLEGRPPSQWDHILPELIDHIRQGKVLGP